MELAALFTGGDMAELEMIQVTPTLRVQESKIRRVEIATEELLDNSRTASHYFAGQRAALVKGEKRVAIADHQDLEALRAQGQALGLDFDSVRLVTGRDAHGDDIVLGQPMEYIDHLTKERCWNVYVLFPNVMLDPKGRPLVNYKTGLPITDEAVEHQTNVDGDPLLYEKYLCVERAHSRKEAQAFALKLQEQDDLIAFLADRG